MENKSSIKSSTSIGNNTEFKEKDLEVLVVRKAQLKLNSISTEQFLNSSWLERSMHDADIFLEVFMITQICSIKNWNLIKTGYLANL